MKITEVLAAHAIECTGPGEVSCRCHNPRGWMSWSAYRSHVAAEILAHLRAVAADEGVRERVANAVPLGWTERDPYRDVFEAADAALTTFLDHLDHGRAGDAGEGAS